MSVAALTIAELLLTAAAAGLRVELIAQELKTRRTAGETDEQILAWARGLAQRALDDAQAAIDERKES